MGDAAVGKFQVKYSVFFHFIFLISCIYRPAYSILDAWEEDLKCYTVPSFSEDAKLLISGDMISGEDSKEIKKGEKAAITLCTTHLNWFVEHASLVFELVIKPLNQNTYDDSTPLSALNVHFGGDGDSQIIDKSSALIDNTRDTLRKIHRGKRVFLSGKSEETPPTYEKKITFVVPQNDAQKVLSEVEQLKGLSYKTLSLDYFWKPSRTSCPDNCCTFVSRILSKLGIKVNHMRVGSLVKGCNNYPEKELEENGITRYVATKEHNKVNKEAAEVPDQEKDTSLINMETNSSNVQEREENASSGVAGFGEEDVPIEQNLPPDVLKKLPDVPKLDELEGSEES